jgi:hypothetical protein
MHVYQWLIIHFAPFDHSLIYIVRLKTSHKSYQEKPVRGGCGGRSEDIPELQLFTEDRSLYY